MSAPEMSQKVARELVEAIADDHGYVPESIWKALNPEHRETLQRKVRKLENIAGTAISTLAKNLYTSDARFVFELLQNAEDNSFTKARNSNLARYVSFEVYPHQIIIECNEDGFQPENLKAICAVGKSSKSGAQKGYVGEKGIGFKSVFMAAWEVHIESGYFSFFFKHKKGDQGLGMITPVWEDPDNDEPYPGTRMVLKLGDGYGPISPSQYQIILDQFNSLKESILLFMRNIEEIRISIFDNGGELEKSNTFSRKHINGNLIRLTQVSKTASRVESSSRDYYIFKHTVGGLEKNEIRTYSEYDEENKTYASAEIVLGFPLTEESVPIVEYQEIFTFLPMKQAGFTFLINSDFVTQANRQDIVMTSGRNIGIRRGIADAFIQAALEFCDHPKLQYTWMRYLPEKKQHFDPFWSQLVALLQERLNTTAILRPRSEDNFRLISSLRYSVEFQLDSHGEPLFRDNNPEMHISKRYSKDDIMILRSYGLPEYTASEILDAISLDLNTSDPRMRSKDMDDDWHTRSANYLKSILLSSNTFLHSKLLKLQLLPLQGGTWIAAVNQEIFLPEADGLEVPPALDLNIIDSEATQNATRRLLFRLLGAKEAEISFLRHRILERKFRTKLITECVAQLRYMFLTDKHRPRSENTSNIWLLDTKPIWISPFSTDIYMPDDKPFGPSKLLENVEGTDGLSVHFLHPYYLNQFFQGSDEVMQLNSWKNWLCSYAGVRRHLRIISKEDRHKLSKECRYVASHLPDKFLGYLSYNWGQESKEIKASSQLIDELRFVEVPFYGDKRIFLSATHLPLPNLKYQWERFSRGSEHFPFLQLDNEVTHETYVKDWGFLVSSLDINAEENLDFYLEVLYYILEEHQRDDIDDFSRIFELYGVIYGKYLESPDDKKKNLIRNRFQQRELVYIPKTQHRNFRLVDQYSCVWEGPESLTIKEPLEVRYKALAINNLPTIRLLFTDVLGVGNCDEKTICDQLNNLRESGSTDFDRIKSLYKSLWGLLSKNKSNEARELVKSKFVEGALIYTKLDSCWNKVSQCLWSSATTVRSKKMLESDYKEMKSFFVDFLRVETLTLGLIYTELSKLGESKPTVELVKEQFFAFKDHFHMISNYKNIKPDEMKKFKIFPIRQPGAQQNIQFCDGIAEFAIADTRPLEDNFRNQIKTLGFTFDELHSLGPVIRWLGLEKRYLSRLVTETSKVDDDDRVLNHSLSHNIESRARALCRIAKHFNSPRWRTAEEIHSLYYLLKQAKVFETDKISCVQVVQQGERSYNHEISRSKFHLEESGAGLDIFVPQEKKSRALCLARDLPSRLFEWMTTSGSTKNPSSANDRNHSLVKDILKEDSDIYNQILLEEGIVDIDIEDEETFDEEDSVSTSSTRREAFELSDSTEIGSNMATPLTDMSSPRMDFDHGEILATVVHQDTIVASSRVTSSQNTTGLFVQQTSPHASGERIEVSTSLQREVASINLGYAGLLSHVVSSARRASIPMKGTFGMDALRESLPSLPTSNSNNFGISSYGFNSAGILPQMEREKMIGAAGELYIFELLKACNPSLPDFGMDNWKSTIRWYAKKHPEYASMQPWHGRETSDLVYHDKMGTFTKLLIDNCYFDARTWEHRRPTYHFEVKTSVSSCETRFFVSKNQYKMLHDNRGKEDSVYIIMRVFNLVNGNIGLRLYVDPAELEAKEELLFTAETWSVVPGA